MVVLVNAVKCTFGVGLFVGVNHFFVCSLSFVGRVKCSGGSGCANSEREVSFRWWIVCVVLSRNKFIDEYHRHSERRFNAKNIYPN